MLIHFYKRLQEITYFCSVYKIFTKIYDGLRISFVFTHTCFTAGTVITRPVTRRAQGGEAPSRKIFALPGKMGWTCFETIGHNLKQKKRFAPAWLSQTGYRPCNFQTGKIRCMWSMEKIYQQKIYCISEI